MLTLPSPTPFVYLLRNTRGVCKSNHVECGIENLKGMPAVSLRTTRIKFAGASEYAPFFVRLKIAALGVLRSEQRDMDYVLVNAHEY